MGYDSKTISKTLEYYIQEIQLHRDSATCTVFEALGELTPPRRGQRGRAAIPHRI
jgi:hypothetical protein